MEILFAFLGAILGGVITVQYMYVSDRLKFRGDVMVEVVAYCDNVYQLIQEMHAQKNAFMANNLSDQMSSEYGAPPLTAIRFQFCLKRQRLIRGWQLHMAKAKRWQT